MRYVYIVLSENKSKNWAHLTKYTVHSIIKLFFRVISLDKKSFKILNPLSFYM